MLSCPGVGCYEGVQKKGFIMLMNLLGVGITVDFTTFGTDLETALQSPISIGLGIGVAVFGIFYGWRLLKRSSH